MADTQPPGGWPWGKSKQGTNPEGSEAAHGSQFQTQDKSSSQGPELQQLQPQSEDQQTTPTQQKEDAPSQVQSKTSAFRSPESVGNKSVKYEDDEPVSVKGPGSNKSFSRTGKDPSVVSNGVTNGAGEEEVESQVEGERETASSKKDDIPEDEGKDLTEPAENAGEEGEQEGEQQEEGTQQQTGSQTGSRFSNLFSGAKNIVPSIGGSGSKKSQADSQIPESIRQIQEEIGSTGETLTLPEEEQQASEAKTSDEEEETPAETVEGSEETSQEGATTTEAATTARQTAGGEGATEALTEDTEEGLSDDGEELRPEDSITHAADNSRLTAEDQEGAETERPTETLRQSEVPTDQIPQGSQTQLPEGVSQSQLPTEQQEGSQTQLPEGVSQSQLPTDVSQSQLPTDVAQSQLPEGVSQSQLPTEAQGSQAPTGTQVPEGSQAPTDKTHETVYTYASGYPTATMSEPQIDYSILKGCKINKLGNVVNDKGQAIGRITQGITSHLIGRKVDENGIIWNDSGKEIGRAEPIPDNELQDLMEPKPFESFEGNTIDAKGWVIWNGEKVGKVTEGDLKILQGKTVDADGDILDRAGNTVGKAERWEEEEEPEPEPEPEKDRSILAGKRVNKAGNLVDSSGVIYGRVVDGDPKQMIGRMSNKLGEILSESGDVIGHAEVVTEGEREGSKEGPFAELSGLTVTKEGKVVTPGGDVVGRLVKGDPKILAGRSVDEDGDVLDRNGNVIGHAERWEEPEVEKEKGPLAGLRVNNDGNVVDKNGTIIAKLTSGDPLVCAGKEIDDDNDVVNSKGMTVGHVNFLSEIPQEEEVGETEEEKELRLSKEQDKKLAIQMAACLEQCLDKINPICKMITQKIEAMERKPEEERDEEQLVKEVRPLIEEGGNILREAHGVIRGLDPDGHIQANAKHKSGTREATPEEFHLAEVIKEVRYKIPLPPPQDEEKKD